MPRSAVPPRMARVRQQRQADVTTLLQALSMSGPVPSSLLAARLDLPTVMVVNTLHELEANPGPGPLFIDAGWVWVA